MMEPTLMRCAFGAHEWFMKLGSAHTPHNLRPEMAQLATTLGRKANSSGVCGTGVSLFAADVFAEHIHARRILFLVLARRRQRLQDGPIGRVRARCFVQSTHEILFHRLTERATLNGDCTMSNSPALTALVVTTPRRPFVSLDTFTGPM